jgi:hypothetical protein
VRLLQQELAERFTALQTTLDRLERAIESVTAMAGPTDLGAHLAAELARLVRVRRTESEALTPILRRLVLIERLLRGNDSDIGAFPKLTRKRPLGK